ncbi:nucleoside recognition domain-containing protein [Candidatus Legionella polyplacis]|uniref:Nucleoside recognition domain-containing protein n=1 Tax=Candidatus Legionella polyplacis TaxID=2005262 RepID=A0ABZ2GVF7_9GAMM
MINLIWLSMIILSFISAIIQNRVEQLMLSIIKSAKFGFQIAINLSGIMALWLGVMRVILDSGLINYLSRVLNPIMYVLFPDIPIFHPAIKAMSLNIIANILGLSNAATPFGLQAMKELHKLNNYVEYATHSMCTFVAINVSSVQVIPITTLALLSMNGNLHPGKIVGAILLATSVSTIVAIFFTKSFERYHICE